GDQSVDVVRANPYALATDVWGIGFKSADQLARRLGFDPRGLPRARAALRFVLKELSQKGHVGCPEAAVLDEMLGNKSDLDIPEAVLRAAILEERKEGEVVVEPNEGEPWLYLKGLFLAELNLARAVGKLRQGEHPLPSLDLDAALRKAEARM